MPRQGVGPGPSGSAPVTMGPCAGTPGEPREIRGPPLLEASPRAARRYNRARTETDPKGATQPICGEAVELRIHAAGGPLRAYSNSSRGGVPRGEP